jgi:hypothetical protein
MKLKYRFIVRNVGGKLVAVAVGTDNEKFNGMVKLNANGEMIFKMLNEGEVTLEQIVDRVVDTYGVERAEATAAVTNFVNYLRDNGLLEE